MPHRKMSDPAFRTAQMAEVKSPHVGPINALVDDLRDERGEWMPYVAPTYGGIDAEILMVLRDPGPRTQEGSGSGMLSAENDDPGAERAATLLDEAGLDQRQVLSWNAYPWYINRKPTPDELDLGVDAMVRLLELLPKLGVVMLLGGDAKSMWRRLGRKHPDVADRYQVIESYHTGNQAFIGTAEIRQARLDHLRAAFAGAAAACAGTGSPAHHDNNVDHPRVVSPETTEDSLDGETPSSVRRLGELVVRAATGAADSRWEAAQRRASRLRGDTEDERIATAVRSFSTELGVVGAATGATAAAPNPVAVAAAIAEVGATTRRLADLILTVAAIRGMSGEDVEERKAWVLAVLAFGNSASVGFSKLAGEMGKGLGAKATAKIPTETLRQINRKLNRTIITKYGQKRGVIAIGKLLPLGIGAAIGGTSNYVLVRQVGRHADRFFEAIRPLDNA